MPVHSSDTDRRAFLKGSLVASSLICATTESARGASDDKPVSVSGKGASKPTAGPIKINWIKIIKDGDAPKRVFYEGQNQNASSKYWHYFDLTSANAGQVAILASSMATENVDVLYTGDSGANIKYISADRTAPVNNADPRLPAGVLNSHENVKDIRN